jgi:hypothetical protein
MVKDFIRLLGLLRGEKGRGSKQAAERECSKED